MKNSLANSGTGAELGASVSGPQSYSLVPGKKDIQLSTALKKDSFFLDNTFNTFIHLISDQKSQKSIFIYIFFVNDHETKQYSHHIKKLPLHDNN